MALVVFAPLITAGIVLIGALPGMQAERAAAVADQAAASAAVTLTGDCISVGDSVRAVSQSVADAATTRGFDKTALDHAVNEAADGHPGMSIAVVDPDGALLAYGGPIPGDAAAEARANLGASCAVGRPPASPGLAETAPIQVRDKGTVRTAAQVVAWVPIHDQSLTALADSLALTSETELAVSSVRTDQVVAATDPEAVAGPLRAEVRDEPHDAAVAFRAVAGTGYRVYAVTAPPRTLSVAYLLPALALAVAGMLLALVVVSRLTRPLAHVTAVAERLGGDPTARTGLTSNDEVGRLGASFDAMADELQAKTEELQTQISVQRQAADLLRETFAQFGEALGSTHNLGALLEAVLSAGVEGARAVSGSIHVADGGTLHETATLPHGDQVRGEARAVLAGLRELALDCFTTGTAATVPEVDGAGAALAVPLRSGPSVVGVLAVALGAGSPAFDPAARDRLVLLAQNAGTAIANVRDHEESRRLSVTDALTGAGNLRKLTETLDHEVDRSARFGRALTVLMLDLDYFKQVNDTLGHDFGDGVLRQFAQRLQACLRDVDTVARYGGEEFAVILPETDAAGAARVADRIVQAVRSAPFVVGDRSRQVTVSVGVAQFPVDGRTSSEVMRAADAALYQAKRSGRDRWSLAQDGAVTDPSGLDDSADPSPASRGSGHDR